MLIYNPLTLSADVVKIYYALNLDDNTECTILSSIGIIVNGKEFSTTSSEICMIVKVYIIDLFMCNMLS